LRAVGTLDGQDRIFAVHKLNKFPIAVVATTMTSAALADWRLQATAITVAGVLVGGAVIVVFILILREINRRQDRTQKVMDAQQLQLDVALEHMSQGLCMYDAQGRLIVCNERFIRMLGLSRDVVRPGAGLWTVLKHASESGALAADPERVVEEYQARFEAGKPDEELETKDGRVISTVRLPIGAGGWVVTFEDITERRRAELERDRNREFLDRVIDSVPSIIIVKDAIEKRYRLINKAGEHLWGLPRSSIIGKTAADLFPKDTAEEIARFERQILASDMDVFFDEHPFTSPAGLAHYVTARAACIRDGGGKPQYLLAVIEDVTDRRLVRQQLQQAQRMESVGRLTGGLAHDFNNLLLIMIGNLDLLARDVEDRPAAAEKLQTVLQASLRGADLTRQLLAFSRRQPLAPKQLQVNDLIRNTTSLLQRTLGQDMVIQLKLADHVWPVAADEAQLEAALVNIAINARDAMPEGGKLLIETHNTQLGQDYCDQHTEIVPGDYVAIEITDTGTGMPPEVLSRIFEPFFTTKPAGVGTGLGLSTVFGFVRQSGGHINAYSEVGIGTTFKFCLPRTEEHARDARPYTAAPGLVPDRTHSETVLVVEDNPEIRLLVVAQLGDLGYRAVAADDVFDALEKLDSTGADLLFTDMVMPGAMNGKQLATIAGFKHPGLKVLFTSGFPGTADFPGTQLEPDDVLLKKPYRKAELGRAIRAILHGDTDDAVAANPATEPA
jgi:PAS domain S-box-containing protein